MFKHRACFNESPMNEPEDGPCQKSDSPSLNLINCT